MELPAQGLDRLVATAADLVDARYAALGVPDDEGDGFAAFVTTGMSDELVAALGDLPRTHGMLGAMLESTSSYRTADITRDARFRGWWPDAHPQMRSFLGVPIVHDGSVAGAFYLTEKIDGQEFTARDQRLIEVLAAHAGLALENARLVERQRELGILEERARLARDLHDAVSQTLFSLHLSARTARDLLAGDPDAGAEQLDDVIALARTAQGELRELIEGLRPPDLETEGLAAVLRKQAEILARAHRARIELDVDEVGTLEPATEHELLRIAQEAMQNALRHAGAERIDLELHAGDGRVLLGVRDDGRGFDPDDRAIRGRRLGLTTMRERAGRIGASIAIDSAPGRGTRVAVEVRDA